MYKRQVLHLCFMFCIVATWASLFLVINSSVFIYVSRFIFFEFSSKFATHNIWIVYIMFHINHTSSSMAVSYTHLDVYKRQFPLPSVFFLFTFETFQAKQSKENVMKQNWLPENLTNRPRGNFLSKIEHDVHGRQMFSYKILSHLSKSKKYMARINLIGKNCWIKHSRGL